jgi:hypothetical protein
VTCPLGLSLDSAGHASLLLCCHDPVKQSTSTDHACMCQMKLMWGGGGGGDFSSNAGACFIAAVLRRIATVTVTHTVDEITYAGIRICRWEGG